MAMAEHGSQNAQGQNAQGAAARTERERTGGNGTPDGDDKPLGRRREDRIVGASGATQRVIELAAAASRSDLPVLVSGPAGSGKAFVARAIHAWSARAGRPFVSFVCSSAASDVATALLGGDAAAPGGALAQADDGTLLVRDADRLDPVLARRLLQASRRARLVFSGAAPLGALLGDASHLEITLTPLVERREDVLPLAAHFLATTAEEIGVRAVGFTPEARAFLVAEAWPGNVRELRARVRLAVRLAGDGAIGAEALLLAGEDTDVPSFKDAKRAFETRYVMSLLRRCGGNISRAARLAKKDRKDFYDVIRRTGVDPTNFRA
jgi:two-component system response regulator GlrR